MVTLSASYRPNNLAGFTLVELVVVIVLLGALAVFIAPRIQGTDGVANYVYQDRLISALRTMQQKAMNDTRSGYCFQINVTTGSSSSFGPPTLDYSSGNEATTCDSAITINDETEYITASESEMAADGITISFADMSTSKSIGFDNAGCPISGAACSTDIQIEIGGDDSVFVCVESQGYIHACP